MLYVLIILTFLVRAFPRILYPEALVYDTYFHLYVARKIRANKFRFLHVLPKNMPYQYTYPQAYHYLLALFSEKWRLIFERFTSPFFDTLTALVLYYLCLWIQETQHVFTSSFFPYLVLILYCFSPALLRRSNGPRVYSGSPRVMAQLLYLLHAGLAMVAIHSGSVTAASGSVLSGAILVISAKFGNQVLIFFGLISLLFDWHYIPFLLMSMALSFLFFPKHAVSVLKGQIQHSFYYFTFYRHVFIGFKPRKFNDYIESIKKHGIPKLRKKKYLNFLFWMLDEDYPAHLVIVCFTPLCFGVWAFQYTSSNLALEYLYSWLISACVCFIATKSELLMFLGEGERYLEYAMFPMIFLSLIVLGDTHILFWALIFLNTGLSVICLLRMPEVLKSYERSTKYMVDILDALNLQTEGAVLTLGYCAYPALLLGNKPVIGYIPDKDKQIMAEEDFKLLYENLPLPSGNFKKVQERFPFKYILTQNWAWKTYLERSKQVKDIESSLRLIYSNEEMKLFEVSHVKVTDSRL